jgi:hypothetical protein
MRSRFFSGLSNLARVSLRNTKYNSLAKTNNSAFFSSFSYNEVPEYVESGHEFYVEMINHFRASELHFKAGNDSLGQEELKKAILASYKFEAPLPLKSGLQLEMRTTYIKYAEKEQQILCEINSESGSVSPTI